jgi:hypothetical protein
VKTAVSCLWRGARVRDKASSFVLPKRSTYWKSYVFAPHPSSLVLRKILRSTNLDREELTYCYPYVCSTMSREVASIHAVAPGNADVQRPSEGSLRMCHSCPRRIFRVRSRNGQGRCITTGRGRVYVVSETARWKPETTRRGVSSATWAFFSTDAFLPGGISSSGELHFIGRRRAKELRINGVNCGAVPPFVRRNCRSYVRENMSISYVAPPFGPYAAIGFVGQAPSSQAACAAWKSNRPSRRWFPTHRCPFKARAIFSSVSTAGTVCPFSTREM